MSASCSIRGRRSRRFGCWLCLWAIPCAATGTWGEPSGEDALAPRGFVAEHRLEHRWSEGKAWRLLPAPSTRLTLHIRVGENFEARMIRARGDSVLVIWLPHAAGSEAGSEIVARLATARGWAVASLLPPGDLPARGDGEEEWISLFEERVRAGREALRVSARERVHCTALLGASVGGVAALRIAELEPNVDGVAAMLSGAGPSGLLHAARAYGATSEPLPQSSIARLNALDPAAHAGKLNGRPVLLVWAYFDEVFPRESFESLRAAFPDAALHSYPTGHESFVYVFPLAVKRALDWVEQACGARTKPAAQTPPAPAK